ncbi:hypothetical protein D8M04_16270 [Oceanobacillus piezotolerans]|uniref:YdbS-like PH domain-containing protein n=1 Tax=Oceanobacillus piezotolerans TaxID=2448030 RepID=A0A498D7V7_9BACI|nr:PH domain-containing protein [Oceanobacillus piezotolerans]RLL42134.1 hypothetical protein D8M04_16270 [Oceanobacillus piezotolerans]
MRETPKSRIALDAIKAWKLIGILIAAALWLVSIIGMILYYFWGFPIWIVASIGAISAICTYLFIFLVPKLRWKKWRYEILEQEIYIQHGILITTRTLVPMIRVQHVDTKQGPILKKYRLASVTISTAASTHEIPALLEEDASDLRDRISALARVDEDDV